MERITNQKRHILITADLQVRLYPKLEEHKMLNDF